jgi:hypothetical protein
MECPTCGGRIGWGKTCKYCHPPHRAEIDTRDTSHLIPPSEAKEPREVTYEGQTFLVQFDGT